MSEAGTGSAGESVVVMSNPNQQMIDLLTQILACANMQLAVMKELYPGNEALANWNPPSG